MELLQTFRDRQEEIASIIKDLRAIMTPDQLRSPPACKAAHNLLCNLGNKLKAHLAAEDKGLYPPLLTQEDPILKSLAWGFISGEKPLRKQFEAYYKRWLKDCDFQFTEAFLRDSYKLFAAIERRLNHEKSVLIPKLEQCGLFSPVESL